ncbi:hypothetical protein BH10PAT1_BH10PAT1_2210 [soil metagenome]
MAKTSSQILQVAFTLNDLNNLFEKSEKRVLNEIDKKLDNKLKNYATKKDLENFATKKDLELFATKKDLENFATKKDLQEAIDAILQGMDNILKDIPKRKEVVLRKDLEKLASL